MKYFLYKLVPPRPTFHQDMTEVEGKVMQEHGVYWRDLADRRIAVVVGPVIDPKGVYGLAIVEVEDESGVHDIGTKEPAIKAGGFRYEVYSMPEPILRK